MAITITASLDATGVKTGASQAASAISGLAATAGASQAEFDSMVDGLLEDEKKLCREVAFLADEFGHSAAIGNRSFHSMDLNAKKLATSVSSIAPANISQKITAVATSYLAVVDVAKKVSEWSKKAGEAVFAMAEKGNPAAKALADSLSKMKAQLLSIAEDPVFQDSMLGIAEVIKSDVIPAIKSIPDAWIDVQQSLSSSIASAGEFIQVFGDDTLKMLDEMHESEERARAGRLRQIALDKEALALRERMAAVEDGLWKTREERVRGTTESYLALMNNETSILHFIKRESEALKQLAKDDKLTAEERERRLADVEKGERRLAEFREEQSQREQARIDEEFEARQEAHEQAAELEEQEIEESRQRTIERLQMEKQKHQASLDMERKVIDERKRLLTGRADGNAAEQLLKGQDPAAIRKAFAERQAALAERQARADAPMGDNPAENRARERGIAKQRQRALGMAQRQFDRGEADPEAVREAQQGLADQTVRNALKGGKLSKETAIALGEATREMIANQNELDRMSREVENLKKIAMAAAAQGNRRRAQNAGARQ